MSNGINPTPEFIAKHHTGNFIDLLPDTLMVKGAKNDRGFNQAYAIRRTNKKEYVLIDAVELATKEAVEKLIHNGNSIRAIIITGEQVMADAYTDLANLSKETGNADIYVYPQASVENQNTKKLTNSDSLLKSFDLEVEELPEPQGGVALFCRKNGGMLFPGDSAKGAAYDTNASNLTRNKIQNKSKDFEVLEFWRQYSKEFQYIFPRQGKPVIDIDAGARSDILFRLSKGE